MREEINFTIFFFSSKIWSLLDIPFSYEALTTGQT
jgi:hypothetical protein